MDNNRDLIKLEIEQIKNQVQLLEDIFEEYNRHYEKRLSVCRRLPLVCEDFIFSIKYYYDYLLHKFGYGESKEE